MLFTSIALLGLGVGPLLAAATELPRPYSTWMLESVIARKEGVRAADGLLSEIQKGFFQESLREAIAASSDPEQAAAWTEYHRESLQYGIDDFTNAVKDSRAPLDRVCAGRSILQSDVATPVAEKALQALRQSIDLQLRSANGGFWYFADPPLPYEQYGNLSYSDGMYGFAPFATLYGQKFSDGLNINSALEQLEILYQHVHHAATGLIVHGYDASKSAPWADSKTGASPMVWGRSMAWYLIGLVDALELAENDSRTKSSPAYKRMRTILHDIARANVVAARHSATVTGSYAVWQVVDQPGAEGNYIEASASAMIAFVLAKSLRLGYISDHVIIDGSAHSPIRQGAYGPQQAQTPLPAVLTVGDVVRGLYDEVVTLFVVENDSGLLEFHGTSIIASLHEARPNFDYYVNRARVNDSLIGSSAFILASLEMERWLAAGSTIV